MVVVGAIATTAASEGGGSSLIEPQLGTIFWTLVTFIVLAFVLGRFAWKPLIGALDEREQGIRSSIDQARTDREEAEKLLHMEDYMHQRIVGQEQSISALARAIRIALRKGSIAITIPGPPP